MRVGPASSCAERQAGFGAGGCRGLKHPLKDEDEAETTSQVLAMGWGQGVTIVSTVTWLAFSSLACLSQSPALLTGVQTPELSFQNLKSSQLLPALGKDWALFLPVPQHPAQCPGRRRIRWTGRISETPCGPVID